MVIMDDVCLLNVQHLVTGVDNYGIPSENNP